jgi:hypothetical protein
LVILEVPQPRRLLNPSVLRRAAHSRGGETSPPPFCNWIILNIVKKRTRASRFQLGRDNAPRHANYDFKGGQSRRIGRHLCGTVQPLLTAAETAQRFGMYDVGRLERMVLRHIAHDYFILTASPPDDEDPDA